MLSTFDETKNQELKTEQLLTFGPLLDKPSTESNKEEKLLGIPDSSQMDPLIIFGGGASENTESKSSEKKTGVERTPSVQILKPKSFKVLENFFGEEFLQSQYAKSTIDNQKSNETTLIDNPTLQFTFTSKSSSPPNIDDIFK